MKRGSYINTRIGLLGLEEEDGELTQIVFGKQLASDLILEQTPLLQEVARQLTEYFAGTRTVFSIPIELKGTLFQQKVWKALQEIPYGKTVTYQQIAKMIGSKKAVRAVGNANHHNKIPILIPCHRVIGKNNKLVGYAGGLEIKEMLLKLEGSRLL